MGTPEIDPQARGLIPLRFCEYNHIVPVRLAGRKLSVVAAHPDSYELRTVLAGLRATYDVDLVQATEDDVRSIIDANYYGKCEGCGCKVDYGRRWCATCRHRVSAAQVPAAPSSAAVLPNPATEDVVAGPGLAGKNCPFCQTPIKPGALVHGCEACGIPHHAECWRENGGCTTFGCTGSQSAATPRFSPAAQSHGLYAQQPGTQPAYLAQTQHYPSQVAADVVYAGFWLRVAASIIDAVVTGVGGAILGFFIGAVLGAGGNNSSDIESAANIFGIILGLAYYVGFNGSSGATPGKMAVGIRIVRTNGDPIGYGTALGRYILEGLFALMSCGLAFIVVAVNARKQGWHDQATDVVVVCVR